MSVVHAGGYPIRVLYTTHEPNLTGASRSLLDLLSGLDRTVVEPMVLLRKHGAIEEKLDELDVPYFIVPYTVSVRSENPLKPAWLKNLIDALAARRVARLAREQRVDIIHSNSLLANVGMRAAQLAVLPYVCHIREHGLADHGLVFLDYNFTAGLVRGASRVITISNSVREHFELWAAPGALVTLRDGLDVDSYLLEHGKVLQGETVHLLLAGRIAPGKGQLEAIKATEELVRRRVRCSLTLVGGVGDKDYGSDLRTYVRDHGLGDKVCIKGFTDDLSGEYRAADIALMCSSHEALGRATVEGMLAGCLVIGANAGATPEIIEDRVTGLLYESGNPLSLADAVVWALGHGDEVSKIVEAGQSYARVSYDNKAYARAVTQLYLDVLAEVVE